MPSDPRWYTQSETTDCGTLTPIAYGGYFHNIACNQECTWIAPHHAIHVTGIRFRSRLAAGSRIEVLCSKDGLEWSRLLDTGTNSKTIEKSRSGVACRAQSTANWFKVRVLEGSFNNCLEVQVVLRAQ